MGILARLEQRSIENPRVPLHAPNVLQALGLEERTPAGVSVTPEKALGLTAFWAGVRIISQTIASLPCEVFERTPNGRRVATDHPVHKLLYQRPNPYMTPYTFKEIRMAHLLTWGNSYAEIERDQAGRPVALWPLLPDRTGVEVRNGQKLYWTIVEGKRVWLSADRVLHVPGLGFDGLRGYNVIKVHRDSLGLSIAANEYGAQFFGNSGRPSGILIYPGKLDAEERQRLRDEWNQLHTGLTRAQRTAVLWGGMDWKAVSIPPEEAQFLETRAMQIEEIARILNVNPILLQHFTKVTTWGSGVSQFLTAFAKFTIIPWLEREEDVLNWDLFLPEERGRFYVKYNAKALLRGDAETQAKILEIERRNGIINADEWRELNDLDPLPNGQGSTYYVPVNWVPVNWMPVDSAGAAPAMPMRSERRSAEERQGRVIATRRQLQRRFEGLFRDTERRLVAKEVADVRAAAERFLLRRSEQDFVHWLDDYYAKHQRYTEERWLPVYMTFGQLAAQAAAEEIGRDDFEWAPEMDRFVRDYVAAHVAFHVGSSLGQLKQVVRDALDHGDAPLSAVEQRLREWEERRPGKIAMRETVQTQNAVAVEVFRRHGVRRLRWRTFGENCPYCQALDGRVVGVEQWFLPQDTDFQPDGADYPLRPNVNVRHPPAHEGCDCMVLADL